MGHHQRDLVLVAALAAPLAATAAFAHAFLDHGVPGVGMTVSGPVRELRLYYTQGVVTAFSRCFGHELHGGCDFRQASP